MLSTSSCGGLDARWKTGKSCINKQVNIEKSLVGFSRDRCTADIGSPLLCHKAKSFGWYAIQTTNIALGTNLCLSSQYRVQGTEW